MEVKNILYIDDSDMDIEYFKSKLEDYDVDITAVQCTYDGKKQMLKPIYDLIIVDMFIASETAEDMVYFAKQHGVKTPIFVYSGADLTYRKNIIECLKKLGVKRFLVKGRDEDKILEKKKVKNNVSKAKKKSYKSISALFSF